MCLRADDGRDEEEDDMEEEPPPSEQDGFSFSPSLEFWLSSLLLFLPTTARDSRYLVSMSKGAPSASLSREEGSSWCGETLGAAVPEDGRGGFGW